MLFLLLLLIFPLYSSQDGIYPYEHKYEAAVAALARPHMHALASTFTFTPKEYETLLQSQVLPALRDAVDNKNGCSSRVYIHEGNPVGFITYGIKDVCYRPLLPDMVSREIGKNAMVHHLAVDNRVAGKGYGTLLLQHALNDCKDKKVNNISLWTTGSSSSALENFYGRAGFELTRRTKFHECCYTLRLQPHPGIICARAALQLLSKLKR